MRRSRRPTTITEDLYRAARQLAMLWGLMLVALLWQVRWPGAPAWLPISPSAQTGYLVGATLMFTLLVVFMWGAAYIVAQVQRGAGKGIEELRRLTPAEFEEWVGARWKERGYRTSTDALLGVCFL